MGDLSRILSGVGGRRVILSLGGLYLAAAVGFPIAPVDAGRAADSVLVVSVLIGASGLVLAYGGYRLPQTTLRPDLYDVIASWCLRAIGVMLGILLFAAVVESLDDPVGGILALTGLASVAGLGMGYHDARAKARALDAEDRRREAEQYSQELERYETIVETVNDGICVIDTDNRFVLVNDAYTELVGYDREELVGSHTSLVVAGNDQEDIEVEAEEVQRDIRDGTAEADTYEATLKTASGETIDVESTVAPLPEQDDEEQDLVVVVRDVTERNKREQQLEQQNERLESFAGMLAHELRNPVTIGQIYVQQLSSKANSEAVDYITEAFDRIENMIDVMLILTRGRKAVSEHSTVQLEAAVQEAWNEVETPGAELEVTTDQTIEADETYIRHLFRNLIENAVEHGGADVTVRVGDLPTGFYVADDGTGIPADDRKAIFETGYTTASNHGGMGLGLTFVHEMADVYGWTCGVTESAAGGARFEFEDVTQMRSVTD